MGRLSTVRSAAAFRSRLDLPDPRLPKTIWCLLFVARLSVPWAGSTKRFTPSFVDRAASSTSLTNFTTWAVSKIVLITAIVSRRDCGRNKKVSPRNARGDSTNPARKRLNYQTVAVPHAVSHPIVVRPATAFRWHPRNDLVRVLDVAGLAVHAIGGIETDALAVGRSRVVDHLVNIRRAEVLAWAAEFLHAEL